MLRRTLSEILLTFLISYVFYSSDFTCWLQHLHEFSADLFYPVSVGDNSENLQYTAMLFTCDLTLIQNPLIKPAASVADSKMFASLSGPSWTENTSRK